jgi:hypothetical protein
VTCSGTHRYVGLGELVRWCSVEGLMSIPPANTLRCTPNANTPAWSPFSMSGYYASMNHRGSRGRVILASKVAGRLRP